MKIESPKVTSSKWRRLIAPCCSVSQRCRHSAFQFIQLSADVLCRLLRGNRQPASYRVVFRFESVRRGYRELLTEPGVSGCAQDTIPRHEQVCSRSHYAHGGAVLMSSRPKRCDV